MRDDAEIVKIIILGHQHPEILMLQIHQHQLSISIVNVKITDAMINDMLNTNKHHQYDNDYI